MRLMILVFSVSNSLFSSDSFGVKVIVSRVGADHPEPRDRGGARGKGPYRGVKVALKGPLIVKGRTKGPMQMKTTVVVQQGDD